MVEWSKVFSLYNMFEHGTVGEIPDEHMLLVFEPIISEKGMP